MNPAALAPDPATMFGDSDGSKDAGDAAPGSSPPEAPFPNRELTLSSYLCDKAPPAAAGPSSPPNPAAAGPADDAAANAKLCVERDFLHLFAPKRGAPPGDDSSVVGGKKPRSLDSLQLSLSLSNDTPAPPPASQLRPDRILLEIVSDSVPAMAQVLQDFPSKTLVVLRETVRVMIDAPERRDDLLSLQRKLERRSDLTAEVLGRANITQLEILVAIKNGMAVFVTGKGRVSSSELVEMFLLTRCRNLNCKSVLPVDDHECQICSTKGFCSSCMCMVCQKFDCAANTCSWVGCDVCSHWCHAACALEKNLIRPGPILKGAMGTTEMQFQCLGCNHASEMFGFVKEVFYCCAENWSAETQMKELDFVRKIFAASEDFEGKGLHAKAEEILSMLAKKMISPSDAMSSMLQFFSECSLNVALGEYGNAVPEVKNSADGSQSDECVRTSQGLNTKTVHEDSRYMELNILERIVNGSKEPSALDLALLQSITENFSEKKKIGSGGCGIVYKGILRNGVVAVKRLLNIRTIKDKMFHREVLSLISVKHQNIVRFLGYCSFTEEHVIQSGGRTIMADIRERLLCFEYIRNGSLENYLTDELRGLEWQTRYQIIIGICRGLNYLHEDKGIIHMDLKPGNILLDDFMVPKITDFGLSRPNSESQATTTLLFSQGYVAPEYISGGKATSKSDIYSLGVIIIELVTGSRTEPNINKVLRWWNHRWIKSMKQSSLGYQQVAKCLELALRCKQDVPTDRPDISDIIKELDEIDTIDGQTKIQVSPCCLEDILGISPLEIHIPFEDFKLSHSIELSNDTDNYIAFVTEAKLERFCTEPAKGVVSPRSKCSITLAMQAQANNAVPSKHFKEVITVLSTRIDRALAAMDVTAGDVFLDKEGELVDEVNVMVVFGRPQLPEE